MHKFQSPLYLAYYDDMNNQKIKLNEKLYHLSHLLNATILFSDYMVRLMIKVTNVVTTVHYKNSKKLDSKMTAQAWVDCLGRQNCLAFGVNINSNNFLDESERPKTSD